MSDSNLQYKKTVCPLDCPDACGMIAAVKNGELLELRGDPDHPVTAGFLCSKVRNFLPKKNHSENRILKALIRNGPRGNGDFREASMDEAIDYTVDNLNRVIQQFGSDAILPYAYGGNMGSIQRFAGDPFFHKIGAIELQRTICSTTASDAWGRHCGDLPGANPEQASEADLIILWGINARVTSSHFIPVVNKARKRGAKVVVVDLYRTPTADLADVFIRIQPASDAALALLAATRLIDSGDAAADFVHKNTEGFSGFSNYVKGLDRAELLEATGLKEEEVEKFCRLLSESEKTFLRIGVGLTRNSRGENSIRAILSLAALRGMFSFDAGKGVLMFSGSFRGDSDINEGKHLRKPDRRIVNMIQLADELESESRPIRALFVHTSNPLAVAPDRSRVLKALKNKDLFIAVHEQTMTETAMFADVIFPAATSMESADVFRSYGHHYLVQSEKVVEPPGDVVDNFTLFSKLSVKMGLDYSLLNDSYEERLNKYVKSLAGNGLPDDFSGELLPGKAYLSQLLHRYAGSIKNGTWKFLFSSDIRENEKSPYAVYEKPAEFGDDRLKKKWPLYLITPPHRDILNSTFSEFFNTPGEVFIHPLDAEVRRIENGSKVELKNDRGCAIRVARITDKTAPGLLVAEGVFRGTASLGAINNLTSTRSSETAGGATFHESLVEIYPYKSMSMDA